MTFHIIIKGKEENRRRLKGKTVSEFAKNMESMGWPSEFVSEEHRDRVKHAERRNERPLRRQDSAQISREMGFNQQRRIREIANAESCEFFERGYPDRDENGDIVIRK
jgi:hypothetical protein